MSLFKGAKPIGATHEWFNQNGSWRGWVKVSDWVYFYDDQKGWVCVSKAVDSLSGTVKPL